MAPSKSKSLEKAFKEHVSKIQQYAPALPVSSDDMGILGPENAQERMDSALEVRVCAAQAQKIQVHPEQKNNGDDARYKDFRASFTKGLCHDENGLVDRNAYNSLLTALDNGTPELFERIPLKGERLLVNPQAGLAFNIEGADSRALTVPPAPRFDSREIAAEIVENYWMALLRDVHFEKYPVIPEAQKAANDLNAFSRDFRGAKDSKGDVTANLLFRGLTPGDVVGPYLSQFLMCPVPFGAQGFEQVITTPKAGIDFGTDWDEFLAIQNGAKVGFDANDFEKKPVYIRNGRDLSQYVHIDVLFQAYFNAALILLQGPNAPTPVGGGIGAPLNIGNPYNNSCTQEGFGTFGGPYIAATLCEVATRALKAVWTQKWYLHRRLRPEAYAGRVDSTLRGRMAFDIWEGFHPGSSDAPKVLEHIFKHNEQQNKNNPGTKLGISRKKQGSYLLPLAFPEGSPMHPSYGAGHATVAGACVTLLKAMFDEDQPINSPKKVSHDGTKLEDYNGADAEHMTIGGELNKLANNIAIGRNIAGVHWRSDGTESLLLGEQVAISLLRDHRLTFNERFGGYTFTTFNGKKITV